MDTKLGKKNTIGQHTHVVNVRQCVLLAYIVCKLTLTHNVHAHIIMTTILIHCSNVECLVFDFLVHVTVM